ncbi:hypothetical protein E4U42_003635 [Claviceps africana]|uniref:Fe2OG dioxygenase domain-containing protein n=1 Tax=Claviceps africana TaxID=83212 RepID=A0A8K0NLS5_9HYPO|nr:hypothetical protein E4U42_003635 [Claviceps africana]
MDSSKPFKQADLKSVSLAGLLAGDANDTRDLVEACKVNGFFYLDFRHESTRDILRLVDELAAVGESVFAMSLDEKEEYSTEKYLPSRLLGYKRAGCSVGPFAGRKDGYESFSIHNNGIFGEDALIVPRVIDDNLRLFEKFLSRVNDYTDCILSVLSRELELPSDLKDCHRKDRPSAANMAMLKYLAWGSSRDRIGNMAHTDMGTLTVVFSKSGGLQAMLPGADDWAFIPPRDGHAVVNVGDSLRFLSKGALASSLHRVVPPSDGAGQDKFSVIYFLRPEFDAKFTTHDGKQISSVEWHNQKYALFREASLDAKQHGAILTGRQEYLGSSEE